MQTVIDKFSHVLWIMWVIKHFTWRWFPLGNSYHQCFNDTLRNKLLNGEISYTLRETKTLIEYWQRHYNAAWPHSSRMLVLRLGFLMLAFLFAFRRI